ncbi:MAG: ABC transporter ATP-binding protein [Weeping tea tree witches'-broom phytoplasma]|uniref:ABC transporter ATP-binding protein n=1 Tax=Candidatus Phytoplasma melaleucae TaxID=2982630 RepID=UPI00293A330E|nr:ABC transporter ATP-binding protein [Weeping tea tree witches'-broom phytoplasma]
MKEIFHYLKPFKTKIIISIILIFFVSAINSFLIIFEGKFIIDFIKQNYINTEKSMEIYMKYIAYLLSINFLLYFLCTIAKCIYNKLLIVTIHESIKNIRTQLHRKIHKLTIAYFDKNNIGNIMSIITNDLDMVANGLQQSCVSLISSCFKILMIIIVMFWVNLRLGIVVCLMIPSTLGVIWIINKKSRNIFIQRFEVTGEYVGFLQEKYTGHKEIILYNQQEKTIDNFKQINKKLSEIIFKSNLISGLVMPIINSFTYIIITIIIVIGYFLMRDPLKTPLPYILIKLGFATIQLGVFQSFIQYTWRLGNPINDLSQIFIVLQSSAGAARRIFNFLSEKEEKDIENPIALTKTEGHIEFYNVCFQYSNNKPVIQNMNFTVRKNQTVAIVGPTGSGKTTLINLLVRFYDVDSGAINVDGINIQTIKKENLRNIIGIVLQDSWLFKGTILENIQYGNLQANKEQIIKAAKQAHVHDFIMNKKNGYDTIINEETDNISQGEKQLIAIARTFLRNPTILILDEATSTIDTRIEIIFQKSMQKLLSQKTSFIIAHRLSTIINADIILVLKNGFILEKGNHIELLKQKGFYYQLYQSQFKK